MVLDSVSVQIELRGLSIARCARLAGVRAGRIYHSEDLTEQEKSSIQDVLAAVDRGEISVSRGASLAKAGA